MSKGKQDRNRGDGNRQSPNGPKDGNQTAGHSGRQRSGKAGYKTGTEGRLERGRSDSRLWLFGFHAVTAALLNPGRMARELRCTRTALEALSPDALEAITKRKLVPVIMNGENLTPLAPPGSVHQGIFLAVEPLDDLSFEDIERIQDRDQSCLVVFLDQVTDPHNVGAILRSAAAFGAAAVVTQDRHAPPESAVIAKSASGALESVPWVRVVNLSRAMDELAELGFWRIGLDGEAEKSLPAIDLGRRIALVLGAEGAGLRHGTREHCDVLAKLPITSAVESLNVSNAAAVALYEFARRNIDPNS